MEEIEKNIEEIDKEIAKIQDELNEIYKNVDFNTTDFDGVGDVYSPEGQTEDQQKKIAELQTKQKELKKKKDEIISQIKQEEEKKKKEEEEKAKKAEIEKNIEEIDKEIAKIQDELNEIYKNVDFNTTDFDGVGDVYSPEGQTEDQQKKIAELQTKQKELKKKKDEIISQIKQEEEKKKKEEEEKAKKAEIEKNIEEIDKEIAKIQDELNEIYKNVDFNTTDFDGVGDVYSPEGQTEDQQKKIAELQTKQKELKKKKDEIISQIKQEDKKQEDKKQDDKKQDDKKQDDKTQDDKKQDENMPAIEFRKISFSLLDNEGKYNPNYTVEYSNGMQQKFKPTKYKSKKDERKARRNIKSGIKRLFEKYNVHISGAKVKKLMKHMDIDFLAALGEYKDDSLCAQYLFATYAKLKGITEKAVDLPYALEYDTRTLNAENIDKAEAKQYNKLAKRMNKIGLAECQTEPSFLKKIFGSKNEMIADKSRMTIDEQIAWYNGSKGEKEFDENLYWSNLREAGYSDEELAQIKAGLEPTAAQKYRESKHVPREQLQPMPEKNRDSEENRNKGRKNEDNEIEND